MRVVRALGIPRQQANVIFTSAGHAIDWDTLLEGRYVFDEEFARTQLELCPWPAFLTDQAINVVAANRPLELVFDVDLASEFLGRADRNLLGGASDPHFARYLDNYDDVVSFMIGLAKADPRVLQNMERPAPWLEEPMAKLLAGDPGLITRIMGLWEAAPPVPHRNRHQFEIRWLYRGETPMRFLGVLTIGDLWNELTWNDWIPADAETWATLHQIVADSPSHVTNATARNPTLAPSDD